MKLDIKVERFPAIKPFERLVKNLRKDNKNLPIPTVVIDYGLTSSGLYNLREPKTKNRLFLNPEHCEVNIIKNPTRAEEFSCSMVLLHEYAHCLTDHNKEFFPAFRNLFGNNNQVYFTNTDDNYEVLAELLSSYILDEKLISKYLIHINRQECYTLFTEFIKPQRYSTEMHLPSNYARKIDSLIH